LARLLTLTHACARVLLLLRRRLRSMQVLLLAP
jgi:hypothetical protein